MDGRVLYEVGGALVASAALSFFGAFLLRRFVAGQVLSVPAGRRMHDTPTPLLGGTAALFASIVIALLHPTLVLTTQITALLAGLGLFLILGAVDDILRLKWPYLLFVQLLAAMGLLLGGVRVWYINGLRGEAVSLDVWTSTLPQRVCFGGSCELPVIGSLLLVVWVLAVINSLNWLDGTDGAALAVVLLAFGFIGILSLTQTVNQPPLAILAAIGMGSAAGLLPWNMSPAKMFIGSAGSFGFGFFIAALSVLAGAKVATVALVFLMPAADAAAVLAARIYLRVPVTEGDRRHLHHALKCRGWSAMQILLLHGAVALSLGTAALILSRPWKVLFLLLAFFFIFVVLFLWKVREEQMPTRKVNSIKISAV